MKALSTYMREGADRREQAFREYVESDGFTISTCALGAAYEAIMGKPPEPWYTATYIDYIIRDATGVTESTLIPYPDSGSPGSIFDVVAYCNDVLRWTRERIADYLERYGF